jgi:two-component system, NarL family, response regulator LiaR
MDAGIRVALVNDFELVLEGLRALFRPYAPGIRVVELDVRATPEQTVDVTLFDTYGEAGALRERVGELASDAGNGAVVMSKLDVTNRVQAVALARGEFLGQRRGRGPDTNGEGPRYLERRA